MNVRGPNSGSNRRSTNGDSCTGTFVSKWNVGGPSISTSLIHHAASSPLEYAKGLIWPVTQTRPSPFSTSSKDFLASSSSSDLSFVIGSRLSLRRPDSYKAIYAVNAACRQADCLDKYVSGTECVRRSGDSWSGSVTVAPKGPGWSSDNFCSTVRSTFKWNPSG